MGLEIVENRGFVELEKYYMAFGLENIQVIIASNCEINQLYLDNKKMDISRLNL